MPWIWYVNIASRISQRNPLWRVWIWMISPKIFMSKSFGMICTPKWMVYSGQSDENSWFGGLPRVNIQKAIEHGHGNSLFTYEKMVIFHSKMWVDQRVSLDDLGVAFEETTLQMKKQGWGTCWETWLVVYLTLTTDVFNTNPAVRFPKD